MEGLLKSQLRSVVVTYTEDHSSSVRKARLQGDFDALSFEPGYAVAFRVSETGYRNYTPYEFDPQKGICEIIFHIHGNGPGSDWAKGLREGSALRMVVPRGRTVFRSRMSHHVVIGDETTLGLALAIRNKANALKESYNSIFELGEPAVLEDLQLYGHVISKEPLNKAGRIRQQIFQQQKDAGVGLDKTGFYLAGNADTMRMARAELKQMGVPSGNIFSQAYWAEGRTGL